MSNTIQNRPTCISSYQDIQRIAQQGQERALAARGFGGQLQGMDNKDQLSNLFAQLANLVQGEKPAKQEPVLAGRKPVTPDPVIAGDKPVVPPPVTAGLIAIEPPVMQPVEMPKPVEVAPAPEPVVAGGISVPPPAESVGTVGTPQEK